MTSRSWLTENIVNELNEKKKIEKHTHSVRVYELATRRCANIPVQNHREPTDGLYIYILLYYSILDFIYYSLSTLRPVEGWGRRWVRSSGPCRVLVTHRILDFANRMYTLRERIIKLWYYNQQRNLQNPLSLITFKV